MLIVEDSFLVAAGLEAELLAAGHRVILATDAATALEAMRQRPDLAVVDLSLRDGLSGPDIARALTQAKVNVIVSSGYPAEHVAELFGDIPVAAILIQPFGADDLLRKLGAPEAPAA